MEILSNQTFNCPLQNNRPLLDSAARPVSLEALSRRRLRPLTHHYNVGWLE